ncbi:sulfatase-like hydrolase/transferase [Seonamhaeicola sp. ML3]|uniref:sulfatase-like hydrolase/transferase n=1 Tax=Seonamhaeicola sp. ML3 TaxID=2937786 RepID=UPI00200EC030|nr:sulfatase-like hydrolase/transferase [Seonamhaeicola sp. ML3]
MQKISILILIKLIVLFPFITGLTSGNDQNIDHPNVLFIIGDDMGVDALSIYNIGNLDAQTPNLDELSANGVKFNNVWSAPVCSATRASLVTGKYGINNGVNSVPGNLSTEHKSIFKEIKEQTNGLYKTCVIGKWHLGRRNNYQHPFEHGVDHFMGILSSGVKDYYNWEKYENGKIEYCNTYATKYFTDYAIDWINNQKQPWFMWLAHAAPHAPFQIPPEGTYSNDNTETNKGKYIAMIESLDYEIGRLINGIPKKVLKNTVIIFLGDNGSPGRMMSGFPSGRGKSTTYEGGVRVPLIISGNGVTRYNDEEQALINVSDFYTTFSQIVNPKAFPNGSHNDGISFRHLLDHSEGKNRTYNFMSMGANRRVKNTTYAIRNESYKLIDKGANYFEFYDLISDPLEKNNLLNSNHLTERQKNSKDELLDLINDIVNN